MIIKDYFVDGILQIAIVLSLLRSDLDIFPDTSVGHRANQLNVETTGGPLSGITRTDFGFRAREHVRDFPKLIDDGYNDQFSSIFRDLHALSYYRRFDGVITSFHTWLVSDAGPAGSVPPDQSAASETTGQNSEAPRDDNAPPVVPANRNEAEGVSDLNSLDDFFNELSKEDMELINILYLQDIDLGVSRDTFDTSLACDNNSCSTTLKDLENDQTLLFDENDDTNSTQFHVPENNFPQLHLSGQYVIDTETGELVLVPTPQNAPVDVLESLLQHASPTTTQPVDVAERDLSTSHTSQTALPPPEVVEPTTTADNYELCWEDMFNVLDLQSVLEGNTSVPGADWDRTPQINESQMADTGLMQNVSMVAVPELTSFPAVPDFSPSTLTVPYELSSFVNASLPFYPINNTSDSNVTVPYTLPPLPPPPQLTDMDVNATDFAAGDDFNFVYSLLETAGLTSPVNGSVMAPPRASTSTDDVVTFSQHANPVMTQSPPAVPSNSTVADTNALFQQMMYDASYLLSDDLGLDNDTFMDEEISELAVNSGAWSTDSAVSSMDSPQFHSAVDVPEGAAGGYDDDSSAKHFTYDAKPSDMDFNFYYTPDSHHRVHTNSTSNSSDIYGSSTDQSASADWLNVQHNHSYPLAPGQKSRAEIEEEARIERENRATRSRDQKRAKAMQIPFTVDELIDSSVDHFNELLTSPKLSERQQQMMRDIRRRGKNKLAAQNCRRRKMEVIQTVEDELVELRRQRDALRRERATLDKHTTSLKDKFSQLETEMFRRLRTETGQDYDPRLFSVLQTDDGRVFIVPRDTTSSDTPATQSHDEKSTRKRKPKKKD